MRRCTHRSLFLLLSPGSISIPSFRRCFLMQKQLWTWVLMCISPSISIVVSSSVHIIFLDTLNDGMFGFFVPFFLIKTQHTVYVLLCIAFSCHNVCHVYQQYPLVHGELFHLSPGCVLRGVPQLLTQSPTDGHVAHFQSYAIIKHVTNSVQLLLCVCVETPSELIPKDEIAQVKGRCLCYFWLTTLLLDSQNIFYLTMSSVVSAFLCY